MRRSGAILAALLAAGAAAGGNATPSASRLTNEMRSLYAEMFRDNVPTQTIEWLQKQARVEVARGDLDGGGLSRGDIELSRNMAEASARADRIRHYFGGDLNRDGLLTLEEYKARLRPQDVQLYYIHYEMARQESRTPPAAFVDNLANDAGSQVRTFHAIDTDRSGQLTLREVFDYNEPVAFVPAEPFVDAAKYLVLDSDGDGNVTMAEVDATSAAFFAEQTRAGVGPLPQASAEKADGGRPLVQDAVQCRLPTPSAAARIVRLGAREGGQLSSVALGGQDYPTYAVSIEIEPGTEPLYIVGTSEGPTIWRVSGATQRVEAFIGSSRARDARSMWPAVGVTGLPAALFHTVPHACFGDLDERSMGAPLGATEASQLVVRRLGRAIDVAFGAYHPQGVRLPSAQAFQVPAEVPEIFRNPRIQEAAWQWRDFLVSFRAGLTTLNPRQIVSRAFPEPYQVYPDRAGLAQLIELGALAPRPNNSGDFEILRQIRYPAGFSGRFSLPDGVPRPIGRSGTSRVMSASNPRLCLIGCR